MSDPAWDSPRDRIAAQLGTLATSEFLIVTSSVARAPGDPDHSSNGPGMHTVQEWPRTRSAELAEITVHALALLGANPDVGWEFERDS